MCRACTQYTKKECNSGNRTQIRPFSRKFCPRSISIKFQFAAHTHIYIYIYIYIFINCVIIFYIFDFIKKFLGNLKSLINFIRIFNFLISFVPNALFCKKRELNINKYNLFIRLSMLFVTLLYQHQMQSCEQYACEQSRKLRVSEAMAGSSIRRAAFPKQSACILEPRVPTLIAQY